MAINSMTVTDIPVTERTGCCKPHFRKTYVFLIVGILLICIGLAAYYIVSNVNSSNEKLARDLVPPDPEVPLPPSPSHFHIFQKAAVCTDGPPCSVIGRDILAKNGSAVDATIAAMFCNGIVNMQSMGLGGGFLMTIYIRATKTAITLNAREAAPLKSSENMYKNDSLTARKGPLSIGVPGELRGYWAAHQRFGVLPWRELVEPSLELCRNGYNMSKALWDSVSIAKTIKDNSHFREMFYDNEKDTPKKGNSLVIPSKALCKTLQIIAEKGGDELYNGSLSTDFVEDLKEAGTIITKEDLELYRAKWHEPITVSLPNEEILYSVRPPGGGVLLGFILQILSGYRFDKNSIAGVNNTVLTYHRIVEAFKHAFAKRTHLGDGDFVNVEQMIQNLTSLKYANKIRLSINDSTTYNDALHYGAEFYNQPDHGTAHISVLAQNGDAVSVTSTINHYFGSEVVTKKTGIVMNNVMDDFSSPGFENSFGVPASPANFIKPQKRALSSMSPTIIVDENGDVKMVIGASGGTKITTSIALVVMRNLWFKQSIKEAIDAPRIHNQVYPMEISYEYGNLKQEIDGLHHLGHKTNRYRDRGSIICALYRNATAIYANADYRKGGDVFGIN